MIHWEQLNLFSLYCHLFCLINYFDQEQIFYYYLHNQQFSTLQPQNSEPLWFVYCAKYSIAFVKGLWLVRKMQECTTVFFHRKKTKNNHKNVRKTCSWKLFFVICSYSMRARRHTKHTRHVGTWAREHARQIGT